MSRQPAKTRNLDLNIMRAILRLQEAGEETTRKNIRTAVSNILCMAISEQPIAVVVRKMREEGLLILDRIVVHRGTKVECLGITEAGHEKLAAAARGVQVNVRK